MSCMDRFLLVGKDNIRLGTGYMRFFSSISSFELPVLTKRCTQGCTQLDSISIFNATRQVSNLVSESETLLTHFSTF